MGFHPKVKVGDYYYSDKTFSTSFYATKTCIGIVFKVNDDLKSGMIVGLTEPVANWNGGTNGEGTLAWGSASAINATNDVDGAVNTAVVKAITSWQTKYPAFAWAESLNSPAIAGISWYLPAPKEWRQLYAAMCGLKLVDSGEDKNKKEVNDWGTQCQMPYSARYEAARTAFNTKFTTAHGTALVLRSKNYWSSKEKDASYAHRFDPYCGDTPQENKTDYRLGVRVISKF